MKPFVALFAAVSLSLNALAAVPKYVFLFIGDGMSMPQRMVAEEFALKTGHGPLAMNRLAHQAMTRTKSANAIITDSAAAATAIACGEKTDNAMIGVRPDGSRLVSVAEVAKKSGMKVGIATTVTIVHATPAGFYGHRKNRGLSYQLALDLVASGFDYFAGGGVYNKNDDRKDPEYRGDVFELARKAGYEVCLSREAWAALKPGSRSWSVLSPADANGARGAMDFAIDADGSQPALEEIVRKGIEVLDGPDGFFFMCEGGKVDYAGHANDAATNLRDVLALDKAVQAALAFQKAHSDETLVLVTGDHETGGLAMGFAGIGGAFRVELLAQQKTSVERYSKRIKDLINAKRGDIAFADIRQDVTDSFGLLFAPTGDAARDRMVVTAQERKALEDAFAADVANVKAKLVDTTAHDKKRRYVFAQAVKNVLNAHAGIGWSTGSHTALPTLTTAQGAGSEILVGMTDNTEIGARLKALLAR